MKHAIEHEEKESKVSTDPLSLLKSSGEGPGSYLEAVKRTKILTREEEYKLGVQSFDQGDRESARALVRGHLRFVIHIARTYNGYGLPLQELIQEGNVGLMQAARKYDPHRGVRFISFAVYWIKAEIHEYILRNWRIVKIATTKPQRKLFFNLRSKKKSLSSLTKEETHAIAKDLNVKPAEVREMEGRLLGDDVPFDAGDGDDDGPSFSPSEYVADDTLSPEILVEKEYRQKQMKVLLAKAVQRLDTRSIDIIRRRWFGETKETREELAKDYGISVERIRQIEERAFTAIKKSLHRFEDF